ncbi:hypothetical protein HNY73_011625 [Argiope bruennichi]|uniref:Uncharacterized protein n=1 Tax=Argiope bruennichi TaxID=94029 RepID=A0A8T0EZ56_ARGBR|nr:hypothetical protein HNY73_011625 [Argiope bruennichi]
MHSWQQRRCSSFPEMIFPNVGITLYGRGRNDDKEEGDMMSCLSAGIGRFISVGYKRTLNDFDTSWVIAELSNESGYQLGTTELSDEFWIPVGYNGTLGRSGYQLGTAENLGRSGYQLGTAGNLGPIWIPVGTAGNLGPSGYQWYSGGNLDDLDTSWVQRNSRTIWIPVGYSGTLGRSGYQLGTAELSDDLDTSWVRGTLKGPIWIPVGTTELRTIGVPVGYNGTPRTIWIPVGYNGTLGRSGYQLGTTELSDDLDTSWPQQYSQMTIMPREWHCLISILCHIRKEEYRKVFYSI